MKYFCVFTMHTLHVVDSSVVAVKYVGEQLVASSAPFLGYKHNLDPDLFLDTSTQ